MKVSELVDMLLGEGQDDDLIFVVEGVVHRDGAVVYFENGEVVIDL